MSRPPRFAIDSAPPPGELARITGDELHHVRNVARFAPGDEAVLIDSRGIEHRATLVRIDRSAAIARIEQTMAARERVRLILAQAMIKGPRMDYLVEKAAELGATELWPLATERTLSRLAGREKLARWRRLALAASKQSLVAPPMAIGEVRDFDGLIRDVPRDTLALVCAEGAEPMSRVLEARKPAAILLACGPEGDFTADEKTAAERAGFVAAGLSSSRLRSETAALAALAIAGEWLSHQERRA